MKYWAFISYSHRDRNWARPVQRAIETYRVPGPLVGKRTRNGVVPKRLFPVVRDRNELPASPDLGASIVPELACGWGGRRRAAPSTRPRASMVTFKRWPASG